MISTYLSYFDATVVAVMVLSCLFAFCRGLVKEILSLGAWVGAGMVTLYFFPDVAKELEPHFKSPVVSAGMATLGIYVIALLSFSLVNAIILRFMKEGSDVGFLDNTLGLIFGAIRGAFLVCLGYATLTMVMPEKEYPVWIKDAHTRPHVEKGAVILLKAAPEYLRRISSLSEKIDGKKQSVPVESGDKDKGYDNSERDDLDKLLKEDKKE